MEIKKTLVNMIKCFILLGTRIVSDGWKAYSDLEKEGCIHDFVNYCIEFMNSEDRTVHSNYRTALESIC